MNETRENQTEKSDLGKSEIKLTFVDGSENTSDVSGWRELTYDGYKYDYGITGMKFSNFENNQDLRKLKILNTWLEKLDLSSFSGNSSLLRLEISRNTRLNTLDLSPLGECSNLSALVFNEDFITELDITPLLRCRNLRILVIPILQNHQSVIQQLGEIPKITHLTINVRQVLKGIDLSPLSGCTDLESFALSGDIEELDFSPFKDHKLNRIFISHNNVVQQLNIPDCNVFNSLQRITLDNLKNIRELDLSHLSCLPMLRELSIRFTEQLEKLDLSPLSNCPDLEYLHLIHNYGLKSVDLSPLRSLDNVRISVSGHTKGLNNPND